MTPSRLETILAERGPPPRSATAEGIRLVLLKGWKVTAAAQQVGVSQPSLSRSLKRLRRYDAELQQTSQSNANQEEVK